MLFREEYCASVGSAGWLAFFNFKYFTYFERGEGRERKRERNINRLPLMRTPTGVGTCNPGMCPDWEWNL